jgi:WD40 repeat protein
LWDVATHKEISRFDVCSLFAAFSPDGKILAWEGGDNVIRLFDSATGKELLNLQGHSEHVTCAAFSSDCKSLASGSEDKTVRLWDVVTGKELLILKGHEGIVNSVSCSPDGKILASASEDKTVKLWDASTGKEIFILKGHEQAVNSVLFSHDGQIIASASKDATIRLWDVQNRKEIAVLTGYAGAVNGVAFSPDGRALLSANANGAVQMWDVSQETPNFKKYSKEISTIAFSPDEKIVALGQYDLIKTTIEILDVATGERIATFQTQKGICSLAFSPDGKTLACGSQDTSITLWYLATGKEKATLQGHSNYVDSVAFSPDGKILASGSSDRTIKLWYLATGKEMATLQGHLSRVDSVAFSPDSKILASGDSDRTMNLWDVATGKKIATLQGQRRESGSIAFSPDGKIICATPPLKLWEVISHKELTISHRFSKDAIYSFGEKTNLVFMQDGKTLVWVDRGDTVKVLNLATGEVIPLKMFSLDIKVSTAFISPQGQILALGTLDGLALVSLPGVPSYSEYAKLYDFKETGIALKEESHLLYPTTVSPISVKRDSILGILQSKISTEEKNRLLCMNYLRGANLDSALLTAKSLPLCPENTCIRQRLARTLLQMESVGSKRLAKFQELALGKEEKQSLAASIIKEIETSSLWPDIASWSGDQELKSAIEEAAGKSRWILSYCYLQTGQFARAVETLRKSLEPDSASNSPVESYQYLLLIGTLKRVKGEKLLEEVLQKRPTRKENSFGWDILQYYMGDISEEELFTKANHHTFDKQGKQGRLCEFYYYAGLYHLVQGNKENKTKAKEYFENCLKHEVKTFMEPALARAELKRLEEK